MSASHLLHITNYKIYLFILCAVTYLDIYRARCVTFSFSWTFRFIEPLDSLSCALADEPIPYYGNKIFLLEKLHIAVEVRGKLSAYKCTTTSAVLWML